MAEKIISILSTRELKRELLERDEFRHFNIDVLPFIRIAPDISPETAARIRTLSEQPIVAIFTSVNAVDAIKAHLQVKPQWRIFCIGGATKDKLEQALPESTIIATGKNGKALAEKIRLHPEIKEVVFFCGNQRMNELPDLLKAGNVQVQDIVVYQTVQIPVDISKPYQGVMFFSPSAVHSFFSVNTLPIKTQLFSIGETTTNTIQSYCSNPVVTSPWPGELNMLEMVADYYK
ncbi:MAG TPA: uroporphyrinogen-III synthase [Agriterribacter sp.]|nr:uroporphyrinogen-III synthase [Agriterribacter sp.]